MTVAGITQTTMKAGRASSPVLAEEPNRFLLDLVTGGWGIDHSGEISLADGTSASVAPEAGTGLSVAILNLDPAGSTARGAHLTPVSAARYPTRMSASMSSSRTRTARFVGWMAGIWPR